MLHRKDPGISRKRQAGYNLVEMGLAMVAVAAIIAIGVQAYGSISGNVKTDDQGDKILWMAGEIGKNYRSAGSYTGLSATEINKLSIVQKPMKWNGTAIEDAWGNAMSFSGATTTFVITVGGTTNPIGKDACGAIANKVAEVATHINIGAAATATSGAVSGGNPFKAGSTVTQTNLTTGCNEANTVIAAQFR